jgi:hypothetical protein
MLDEGMRKLTGKRTAADAWKEFVSPTEVIGLKFNRLSRDHTRAVRAIRDAIVANLEAIGVPKKNIVVAEGPVLETAPDRTLDPEVDFGHEKTQLTRFVTKQIDALICIPDLKNHGAAGMTGALKNISHAGGTIMTGPNRFHGNNCDPFIGEINALKPIRERHRLSITNGLKGVFDGGPGTRNPDLQWRHDGFLLSTDPVALDTVALDLLEAERKKRSRRPIGRRARHLATAEELELGNHDRRRIRVVKATA